LLIAAVTSQALSINPATIDPSAIQTIDVSAPIANLPTTTSVIITMQDRLRRNPDDVSAYVQLGWAMLLRVRETGDALFYTQADKAFRAALQRDSSQIDAVTGLGSLALSRHQFREALDWGEKARSINPYRAQVYGILGDAQTELGQYDAAVATVQKMVDTRPDLNSYSRVSYQRELHGDVGGAITAMQQAVAAGNPAAEGTLWAQYQLGNLYFNSGDLDRAEAVYQAALHIRPDYIYARAGRARVYAARGQYEVAITDYQSIADTLPLPEFVIMLGDLYAVSGRTEDAKREYDLVGAIQQLYESAGVDVEMEIALFNIDHGLELTRSLQLARSAYERRPSVYAADTLAWALYRNGQYVEARRYSDEALQLGTRDALLHFHAGLIASALNDVGSARQHLQTALDINPYFSIRYAPQARERLNKLAH
jgi:tetratricopeptide (TPR) repeat protein